MDRYKIDDIRFEIRITDQINFSEICRDNSIIIVRPIYGESGSNKYTLMRDLRFKNIDFYEQEMEIFDEIACLKMEIIKNINEDVLRVTTN